MAHLIKKARRMSKHAARFFLRLAICHKLRRQSRAPSPMLIAPNAISMSASARGANGVSPVVGKSGAATSSETLTVSGGAD